jgi:hypothetical protein
VSGASAGDERRCEWCRRPLVGPIALRADKRHCSSTCRSRSARANRAGLVADVKAITADFEVVARGEWGPYRWPPVRKITIHDASAVQLAKGRELLRTRLQVVRDRAPDALAVFGAAVVGACVTPVTGDVCRWCLADTLAGQYGSGTGPGWFADGTLWRPPGRNDAALLGRRLCGGHGAGRSALLAQASWGGWVPPATYFTDPRERIWVPPWAADSGRLSGYVQVPRSDDLSRFLTGTVCVDDGTPDGVDMPVGTITGSFDDTSQTLAYVTAGRDAAQRVWISGAVRPGVEVARARRLLAGLTVDMRQIRGYGGVAGRRWVGLLVGRAAVERNQAGALSAAPKTPHWTSECLACAAGSQAAADMRAGLIAAGSPQHAEARRRVNAALAAHEPRR